MHVHNRCACHVIREMRAVSHERVRKNIKTKHEKTDYVLRLPAKVKRNRIYILSKTSASTMPAIQIVNSADDEKVPTETICDACHAKIRGRTTGADF